MTQVVDIELRHWLNTVIGMLDSAFRLTIEEYTSVDSMLKAALISIGIDTMEPSTIPAEVAAEIMTGFWSAQASWMEFLPGDGRGGIAVDEESTVVSADAWHDTFCAMFEDAYPNLDSSSRMILWVTFHMILRTLEVSTRCPRYCPDVVIRRHRMLEDG